MAQNIYRTTWNTLSTKLWMIASCLCLLLNIIAMPLITDIITFLNIVLLTCGYYYLIYCTRFIKWCSEAIS